MAEKLNWEVNGHQSILHFNRWQQIVWNLVSFCTAIGTWLLQISLNNRLFCLRSESGLGTIEERGERWDHSPHVSLAPYHSRSSNKYIATAGYDSVSKNECISLSYHVECWKVGRAYRESKPRGSCTYFPLLALFFTISFRLPAPFTGYPFPYHLPWKGPLNMWIAVECVSLTH